MERNFSGPARVTGFAGTGGFDLGPTELMVLALELLDVPFEVWQHVARTMLLGLAAAHGHDIGELLRKFVRTEALGRFFALNEPYKLAI